MSNEPVNKFQNAVNRATAAIGVKTSIFVGSAKLKTQITTLKKEIDTLKENLGITIFEKWEKGEETAELIQEQCEKISERYRIIEDLNVQIEQLEREEANVMGSKLSFICPGCKMSFDEPIKFCRKCGTKME